MTRPQFSGPHLFRVALPGDGRGWGRAAVLALLAGGYAGTGRRLFAGADAEAFLALFFREPFLVLVVATVAWATRLLRSRSARAEEYRLLTSLPLPPAAVAGRFFALDLSADAWFPLATAVVFFGLLRVAPAPYLARLGLLAGMAYVAAVAANAFLQVAVARRGVQDRYRYPERYHPLCGLLVVGAYVVVQFALVTRPALASGYGFWQTLGVLAAVAGLAWAGTRRQFARFQAEGTFYRMAGRTAAFDREAPGEVANPFRRLARLDPLLAKNLVRMGRVRSRVPVVLAGLLAGLVYLISMNNADVPGRVSVILFFALVYAFLFALSHVDRLSPDEEAERLLYALPVRRERLYLSVLLPGLGVLAGVLGLLAAFVLVSGAGLLTAAWFWMRAVFAGLVFLVLAMNAALVRYPNVDAGKRLYLRVAVPLVVLVSLFFRYGIWIVGAVVLMSTVRVRRVRLFRTRYSPTIPSP